MDSLRFVFFPYAVKSVRALEMGVSSQANRTWRDNAAPGGTQPSPTGPRPPAGSFGPPQMHTGPGCARRLCSQANPPEQIITICSALAVSHCSRQQVGRSWEAEHSDPRTLGGLGARLSKNLSSTVWALWCQSQAKPQPGSEPCRLMAGTRMEKKRKTLVPKSLNRFG